MNRFEQLIEYVINDEEAKARELFHEIVVEKSREIYENLMTEGNEEELDEGHGEDLGGDAAGELIDDVEMDEESSMNMEGEEELEGGEEELEGGEEELEGGEEELEGGEEDFEDGGAEPATKDDIMDLESKLDELMAEFEQLMSDEGDEIEADDDLEADEAGDVLATDDTSELEPMAEAIALKQVKPKVTTSEEGNGKSGPVAYNSGKAGMAGDPVRTDTTDEKGRKAPDAKDIISGVQNQPGHDMSPPKAAPKPVTAQAQGVNARSPLPGGRKG